MNEEQATRIATNAIDYQSAQVAERDERIKQLERLNSDLAGQVDRQGKVVAAACKWSDDYDDGADDGPLLESVTEYYGAMAAYEAAKEQDNGISTR